MNDETKTCETCKYWTMEGVRERDSVSPRNKSCGRIPFEDYDEEVFDEPAYTIDGSGYHGALITRDDFGCNLWEQAE